MHTQLNLSAEKKERGSLPGEQGCNNYYYDSAIKSSSYLHAAAIDRI